MLKIKAFSFPDCMIESRPYEISVVGMNSLQYQLQRRRGRSIIFKDLVGFLRPVDLSAGKAPAEAARMAYALPFCEEGFAPVQIRVEARILQRNRGLRSQKFQHCNAVRGESAWSQIVL